MTKHTSLCLAAISLAATALALPGCGSSASDPSIPPDSAGGTAGSGGTPGSGGASGHGAAPSTGGAAGAAGKTGGHAGSSGKANGGGAGKAGSGSPGGKGGSSGSSGAGGVAGAAQGPGGAPAAGASGSGTAGGPGGAMTGGSAGAAAGGSAGAAAGGSAGAAAGGSAGAAAGGSAGAAAGGSAGAMAGAAGDSASAGTSAAAGSGGAGGGGGGGAGGAAVCGSSDWGTYGHDAQRSSASDGCVAGALKPLWHYAPAPPSGLKANNVFEAVADASGPYLTWSAQHDPYVGTTAADKITPGGARAWTFDSGTDSALGYWPSLAFGQLILNDDGLYYLDTATGAKTAAPTGVDTWGLTASDADRLYVVNTEHVDGPGLFMGAYDPTGKSLWQANTAGMCRIDGVDLEGGAFAVDGGAVFYAAAYAAPAMSSVMLQAGLYSFDAAAGTQKWYVKVAGTSALSAGSGLLYLVEGGAQLTARHQSDGSMAWAQPLVGPGVQAPVLAAGLVLIGTTDGVRAFDAASGAPAYGALTGVDASAKSATLAFTGGCHGDQPVWLSYQYLGPGSSATLPLTTLLAATGSGTLLVTAGAALHVLSLSTGAELWSGPVAGAAGNLRNPILVGSTVYLEDDAGLWALAPM